MANGDSRARHLPFPFSLQSSLLSCKSWRCIPQITQAGWGPCGGQSCPGLRISALTPFYFPSFCRSRYVSVLLAKWISSDELMLWPGIHISCKSWTTEDIHSVTISALQEISFCSRADASFFQHAAHIILVQGERQIFSNLLVSQSLRDGKIVLIEIFYLCFHYILSSKYSQPGEIPCIY